MATFSKRHYEAVAEAFRVARGGAGLVGGSHWDRTAILQGIGMAQAEVTRMFAEDNQRFDGERFAQASGMRG